ncbi:unnamed protein product [Closterium sp. NIES-53]
MEVARTSMIHADSPHFLWQFAVRYATHQLNLWPCVSLPETSPTLRWTGKVGDASVFRVWGSRAFVRNTSADKLSARAVLCVFLGFSPDAPSWQFYHPTSRRVFPSQDVTFDESDPFYCLFPYLSAPLPPPPLFLAPGPPPVDPLPPQGRAPSGVSQVDPLPETAPVEVAVGSGAAPGAASGGAEPGGAEPAGAERAGEESEGAGDATSGGVESRGTASSGGPAGALPRLSPRPEPLSPQQLREWFAQHIHLRSGATGARDSAAGDTGAEGARVTTGAGGTGGAAVASPGGARTGGTGVAGTGGVGGAGAGDPAEPGATTAGGVRAVGAGAGGAGTGGAGAVDPGAGGTGDGGAGAGGPGAGGAVRPRPEHREPASRPASPVHTGRRVPRPHPPPVPGTHAMILRPSFVPLRVPLQPPPESSLPAVPDPESDHARAANLTVSRLLATVVTDPSFESTAASALVAELVDIAAACRLDYTTVLVAESEYASPPSVMGECALGTDVLEDRQEDFECLAATVPHFASMLLAPEGDPDVPDISTPCFYAEAITGPYSSQWQAAMDAEMASWKSTGTYVGAVPLSRANIVDGMWIFMVKRPPGSPPAFKVRYVARGFSQRQGVDYFQTFSPTPKMTTLCVLLHVAAQRDYELHSLDFSTAFLQGASTRRSCCAPCEWHNTLRTTLATLGFTPSTTDPSLFLRTDTSLPPFYVLVYVLQRFGFQFSSPQPTPLSTSHSLSAPPSDKSVQPSGPYPELMVASLRQAWGSCLVDGVQLSSPVTQMLFWVDDLATKRSSLGYTFSLGSGSVSWRSNRSSSVLSSSCEAEICAGAMAAQELRWLTYLLTDLGEQPRSPLVLYVDNKAMIALYKEHRLEHRTKRIALQYFLDRDLQQRGQLRLAYMATRTNTADIFTKALPPDDHQRFSTVLCLLALFFLTGLSASPPSVGGECALGTDVLEDRQEDFECLAADVPHFASMLLAPEGDLDAPNIPTPRSYAKAITGPYSSQWQVAMDVEMASWKSTGTYVNAVPPSRADIVNGMWIFRNTTLRMLLHVAAQRDYELHSLDFSTTFLQGSFHEEILLRRPPGITGSFSAGTQWSLWRPVYGLRQAPREWHDTLRTTLAALGFTPSTADPSLFLRIHPLLPPFYVLVYVDELVFATANTEALTLVKSELQKRHTCTDLGEMRSYFGLQISRDRAQRTITLTQSHMVHQVLQRFGFQFSSPQPTPLSTSHSLSAPPLDESVETSGPYPELVGCLMYLMTCTRPDLAYPLSLLACYVAPVHQAWGSCLEDGVNLSSPVTQTLFGSSCEAEIYAGAMAAQELSWLTYLLIDLGEKPRSPQVLYQHGQLHLAYMATRANNADIFTQQCTAAAPSRCRAC